MADVSNSLNNASYIPTAGDATNLMNPQNTCSTYSGSQSTQHQQLLQNNSTTGNLVTNNNNNLHHSNNSNNNNNNSQLKSNLEQHQQHHQDIMTNLQHIKQDYDLTAL